jgi:hypothetical protein
MWFYACHLQVIHYVHVVEIFQVIKFQKRKINDLMMIIGLINNAIIDWFLPWPEQALLAVSTSLLTEDVSSLTMKENEREFVCSFY